MRTYVERLSKENPEYLFEALTNLGERVREEGESSLLTLGMILEEIHILTPRTKTAYEEEVEEMFQERRKATERIQ